MANNTVDIETAVHSLHAHLTADGWPKWLTAVGYKQVEPDGKPDIVVYAKKIKTIPLIVGSWEGYGVIVKKSGSSRPLKTQEENSQTKGQDHG